MNTRQILTTTAAAAAAVLILGACSSGPGEQDETHTMTGNLHDQGVECDWEYDNTETVTAASCGDQIRFAISDADDPDQEGLNEHDEAIRAEFTAATCVIRGGNYVAFAADGAAGALEAATGNDCVTL